MQKLNEETTKIMNERFGKDNVIALATSEDNLPYVRYVNAYYEDGAFYIITYALSNKMKQVKKNPSVSIAGDWFTATGKGVNLGWFGKEENRKMAEKLREVFAEWIDNGHNNFDDVNTCILRIELTHGLLLSHGTRYNIDFSKRLTNSNISNTLVDSLPKGKTVESIVCLTRERVEHEMKLKPAPFAMIQSGKKTIELRLLDEKRKMIKEGDTITFTNTASGEKLVATVEKLHRFASFEELYENLPLLKCGYTEEDVATAHPSDMAQYYDPEEQKQYGVVGIELFLPRMDER